MAIVDYGICRLSLVPVRPGPDSGEQSTQLLFGEHYSVSGQSKDQKWLQITTHDGVAGWIHRLQHHSVSNDYFNQVSNADFKITTDLVSTILYKKTQMLIVMGSIVPIAVSELFKMEEQFAFNGEAKSLGQRRDFEFLKTIGLKYINSPQQEGGRSPFGIDAPGLVQMIFRMGGYKVPRTLEGQSTAGKKVKDTMPGDLAFFKGRDGKVKHVGFLLDDEKVLHCSGRVRVDHFVEGGILATESKIFTHEPAGVRRILQ